MSVRRWLRNALTTDGDRTSDMLEAEAAAAARNLKHASTELKSAMAELEKEVETLKRRQAASRTRG